MPTDGFNFFGDGAGRATLGALKNHVLQQVRDAVDFRRFVAGPGLDPGA